MSPIAISGILGIDHVGIAVADLPAAITFYQSNFGGTLTHQERNEEQGVIEAMVQLGPAPGVEIQLLAPLTPTSPLANFLERRGPGIQQLALRVRNVEEAALEAKALGLRPLYESAKSGTRGAKINFLHPKDCGGVLIELIESAANAR